MNSIAPITVQILRELIYDHLRRSITEGILKPGEFIDVTMLSDALKVSKTPLRDALLTLSSEGFIDVFPRRGFVVHVLTRADIQHLYQLIGALESAAFEESIPMINDTYYKNLSELNDRMRQAVIENELQRYYDLNCSFHNYYIHASMNKELIRLVDIYRQRLYDFPYRREFLSTWEKRSVEEHDQFLAYIQKRDFVAASTFIRAVHWSFDIQKEYILDYYSDSIKD